ncbi:MAG: hypothetical protein AAF316_17420 [Cyanobacteria bacterium P01_A01_bin.80]
MPFLIQQTRLWFQLWQYYPSTDSRYGDNEVKPERYRTGFHRHRVAPYVDKLKIL